MSDKPDPLDAYIDAAAALLGIPIEPEWKDPIRTNLAFTLSRAALVAEKELPDDAEPAAVYRL